jgi:ATP-dependent helicase/DNAse subunit B
VISLSVSGNDIAIKLIGVADRIDFFADHWRIIDYKTGKVENKELAVKEWSDLFDKPEMDKAFQLLMYAWLLKCNLKIQDQHIQSGIIALKKIKSGFMNLQADLNNENITGEALDNFEYGLRGILTGIFDYNSAFIQTNDMERCKTCPYINLCGR